MKSVISYSLNVLFILMLFTVLVGCSNDDKRTIYPTEKNSIHPPDSSNNKAEDENIVQSNSVTTSNNAQSLDIKSNKESNSTWVLPFLLGTIIGLSIGVIFHKSIIGLLSILNKSSKKRPNPIIGMVIPVNDESEDTHYTNKSPDDGNVKSKMDSKEYQTKSSSPEEEVHTPDSINESHQGTIEDKQLTVNSTTNSENNDEPLDNESQIKKENSSNKDTLITSSKRPNESQFEKNYDIYFLDGAPINGEITNSSLTNEFKPAESIYRIHIPNNYEDGYGMFELVDNKQNVRIALRLTDVFIDPWCESQNAYDDSFQSAITIDPGRLQRTETGWKVYQKAKIVYI